MFLFFIITVPFKNNSQKECKASLRCIDFGKSFKLLNNGKSGRPVTTIDVGDEEDKKKKIK